MKIKIIVAVVYFLVLYLIAVLASWNYKWGKDEPHFLGVSDRQWEALLILWLPMLLALSLNA